MLFSILGEQLEHPPNTKHEISYWSGNVQTPTYFGDNNVAPLI